jgi:hypothetical protein
MTTKQAGKSVKLTTITNRKRQNSRQSASDSLTCKLADSYIMMRKSASKAEFEGEGWETVYEYGCSGTMVMSPNNQVAIARGHEIICELSLAESVRWHVILSIVSGGSGGGDACDRWMETIAKALES